MKLKDHIAHFKTDTTPAALKPELDLHGDLVTTVSHRGLNSLQTALLLRPLSRHWT